MKIIEEECYYSILINGKWAIYSPIWKYEGTALYNADDKAKSYSWTKNPICGSQEFKETKFDIVKIDVSKLPVIYTTYSKDLRKKRKKKI